MPERIFEVAVMRDVIVSRVLGDLGEINRIGTGDRFLQRRLGLGRLRKRFLCPSIRSACRAMAFIASDCAWITAQNDQGAMTTT